MEGIGWAINPGSLERDDCHGIGGTYRSGHSGVSDPNFLKAYLYDHDNRFFVGWELDKSWVLCTVSWTVLLFDGLGVGCAALFLPKEDDYELIPEPQ